MEETYEEMIKQRRRVDKLEREKADSKTLEEEYIKLEGLVIKYIAEKVIIEQKDKNKNII